MIKKIIYAAIAKLARERNSALYAGRCKISDAFILPQITDGDAIHNEQLKVAWDLLEQECYACIQIERKYDDLAWGKISS